MLRSMYSGISGLRNFQTKLDVIGNNISNVNTHGFKKGRTIFKDVISQTIGGASAGNVTRGGVNPKQIGLGSQVAAIDTIHAGGSSQLTNNTLDLLITGDGFFQVADGKGTAAAGITEFTKPMYTRAGNFALDDKGYLVNADGKFLVGYSASWNGDLTTVGASYPLATAVTADAITGNLDNAIANGFLPDLAPVAGVTTGKYAPMRIPTNAESMSIGQDGTVSFVDSDGKLRWAGQLVLAKFPNPGGLDKVGGNYFRDSANSGVPLNQVATREGMGKIESGYLEMSNVDLAEEFTEMIIAQRGFQANTRIITTSDEILQELVNLKR
ncbi:flagellar basal body rod protein FlgG [Sporosarcina limicola]|uniref:Flagellar hook protein FlgE n=1 Tax=Sporosarcina limicola TaxID=34101 RepID=A0A927RD88_9BACL|nr:flagellar basal body rod protein FlgG [Sporosarcina limicola]MBE1553457.1 flagellar hook protein FlgE [Sporosarcina limicola]